MKKVEEKSIRIQKICDYLRANIDKPVCLDDFSSFMDISAVTLVKFFKIQFNCTPIDYFWSIKTIIGGYLIYMDNTKTQLEIAMSLGFKSNEHFSRRLKQVFKLNGKTLRYDDSKYVLYAKSQKFYIEILSNFYRENTKFYEFLSPKEQKEMDVYFVELSYKKLLELVNAQAKRLGSDFVFCERTRDRLFLIRNLEKTHIDHWDVQCKSIR